MLLVHVYQQPTWCARDHAGTLLTRMRRSGLLAAHRMPAYRARVLALAGSAARGSDEPDAEVVLCDWLAPRLTNVVATAVHPPLPPQPASQQGGPPAARRWLPAGIGGGAAAAPVRLRIDLQVCWESWTTGY